MVILLHPLFMACLGVVIIIVLIILLLVLRTYLKEKSRKKLIAACISAAILIGAIIFEIFLYVDLQYQLNHDLLEYSVKLDSMSEEPEIVYIPVSANGKLQNSIHIKSGHGEFEIIETEHGLALKIEFTGNISLYGKIDSMEGIGEHDLTLKNQTESRRKLEHWIYYEPSNVTDYNCSFSLSLYHEALDWWETESGHGYLKAEWNTYFLVWRALS